MDIIEIEKKYPLHLLVWKNEYEKLKEMLIKDASNIEVCDPRGRTPLMLGIILGHIESVRILLIHNANAFCNNLGHWTATQEAISTGDPEIVKMLTVHRNEQRIREQASIMTKVLSNLKESPDFYVELKWEFSSWLPLVSRMCPSDICRIWKSGGNVRIDTTLVGFSGTSDWVRGNLSYIFQLSDNGATMDEVNHQECCVYRHHVSLPIDQDSGALNLNTLRISSPPSEDSIAQKLTQPIFVTYVDTEKIEFEKSKSGIWGWRSDKKEMVNGHECHVYSASNVQVVTLKRVEHLTDSIKSSTDDLSSHKIYNPLTSLLSQAEHKCNDTKVDVSESNYNPNQVTIDEYFNPKVILHERNIGRPKSMTTKVKTFKAHLSMCDDYPLSLQNQVLPIIDLMAEFNPHFQKLKDFVTMHLPAGFPMKIEIPLYHILTARITFDNLFASNQSVECVNVLRDVLDAGIRSADRQNIHCIIDDVIFQLPPHYQIIMENSPGHGGGFDEEDQMVQMAVQASLSEYGGGHQLSKRTYDLRHRSVQNTSGDFGDLDDAELQRAIAASLSTNCPHYENESINDNDDEDIIRVLELSKTEK